jgi:hypothetical protein
MNRGETNSGWKFYFNRGEHKPFEIFISERDCYDEYGDINGECALSIACERFVKAAFKISTDRIVKLPKSGV